MTTDVTRPVARREELPYGIAPPGYRLPEATQVGAVRLQIADLIRSLDYYQRVLGMRVLRRTERTATLGADDDASPLVELRERAGAHPVPRRGRLGLYHFAVLLPDRPSLGRFVRHLAGAGVQAGMSDHLVSEAIYLSDPDGLGIEVYADRPRQTWRYDDRQLVMATEPLDASDLIRAGGEEPWRAMPAGTRIGHVHLFVGDLERSAGFYHAGLGFDKVVWRYPGALFLSAGGYHHHLGTNTWAARAPIAGADDARLLEWEVLVPRRADAEAAAASLASAGFDVTAGDDGWRANDPWGTTLKLGWKEGEG